MNKLKHIASQRDIRQRFLKSSVAGVFLTITFLFLFGIHQINRTMPLSQVFAEESKSMKIPANLKDLKPENYTNLVMDKHADITFVTCDEWDRLVSYVGSKKYSEYSLSFETARNGGVFTDKRVLITPKPEGFVLAGRNPDGIYKKFFMRNEATEIDREGKNEHILTLRRPVTGAIKFEYRPDGTVKLIAKNEKDGYYNVIDLYTGKEREFKELSSDEVAKLFAKPKDK